MYNITHELYIGRLGVDLKIYLTHVPDGEPVQDYVYTSLINTRGFNLSKLAHDPKDMNGEGTELVDFETFLYPSEPTEAERKMLKLLNDNNWGEVEELILDLCSSLCVHWSGGHTEGTLQSLVYLYTGKIEKL